MPSVPNELYFVLNTKIMLMSPCPKCVNQALWEYFVFTLMSPTTFGLIACRRESILHEITKLVLLNAWRQLYWGHRNTLCTSALQTLHTSVLYSSIKPQPQLQPHNIPKHHLLVPESWPRTLKCPAQVVYRLPTLLLSHLRWWNHSHNYNHTMSCSTIF